MTRGPSRSAATCIALVLLSTTACLSPPTSFFVLTPIESHTSPDIDNGMLTIGVGPIDVPAYLDRPEIVTRTGANELELSEFNQWAEPIQDNVTRVIGENLASLVPTNRIALFPWKRAVSVDYEVVVQVFRFEVSEGEAHLEVTWGLFGENGKKNVLTRQASFTAASGGADYEVHVAAMSKTLEDLSRQIAEAIVAEAQKTDGE